PSSVSQSRRHSHLHRAFWPSNRPRRAYYPSNYPPKVENPILISTHISHNPKMVSVREAVFTFRPVASENPIPSKAITHRVKMSSDPARDSRGLGVSVGLRKNPGLVGAGL